MNAIQELKILLFAEGMKVSESAMSHLTDRGKRPPALRDYVSTSGIILQLEGDIYVNAPTFEEFCKNSKITLDYEGKRYLLRAPHGDFIVKPVPIARYFFQKNSEGIPYKAYAITHTDRARLMPIAGCAFSCKFCDSSYTTRYATKPVKHLVEAALVALKDDILPARHILISGGTPRPEDYPYLDEVCRAVISEVEVPVDIMVVPRKSLDYVDFLYEIGLDGVYFNIEIFNDAIAAEVMPQKFAVGKEHYFSALKRAVQVFGTPKVKSILLVGLEPMSDTLAGVKSLAEIGVTPILSPFRPSPATPMSDVPPPNAKFLKEVYEESKDICNSYGIKLGPECVPCQHNTLAFP